jgi:hypothetical protein
MTEMQVLVCPKKRILFTVHYRRYGCLPWQVKALFLLRAIHTGFFIHSNFLLNDKW